MTFRWIVALAAAAALAQSPEGPHLKNIRQLTHGGSNAEAYWRPMASGSFSSRRVRPTPCDQIFVMNVDQPEPKLVSTGRRPHHLRLFLKTTSTSS